MPVITISTYSGRTQREKDRLAEAITEDVVKIFGVEKKDVIFVKLGIFIGSDSPL